MRRGDSSGEGGATVECFDLLVPGVGELAGGSAREERAELLAPLMRARGLLSPDYDAEGGAGAGAGAGAAAEAGGGGGGAFLDWYLDLRRFGGAPHAGFGMGFERLVLFATGVANVRDTIAFPRVPGRCAM
jgi:asparaginyl-tRNA synthetase